ncbi:MAG: hypothetical protein JWP98_848, partial [Edaphobacter sp.]|nr:hypothetical protein [Edaphobacter sp.]
MALWSASVLIVRPFMIVSLVCATFFSGPMAPPPTQLPHLRHAGRGHLRSLDGVRGLAILMVLLTHGFESNYQAGGPLVRFTG